MLSRAKNVTADGQRDVRAVSFDLRIAILRFKKPGIRDETYLQGDQITRDITHVIAVLTNIEIFMRLNKSGLNIC